MPPSSPFLFFFLFSFYEPELFIYLFIIIIIIIGYRQVLVYSLGCDQARSIINIS